MKAESLIFDVDGTLWNSVELVSRSWNLALTASGLEAFCTPSLLQGLFGKTMDEIGLALLPQLPPARRAQVLERCCQEEHRVMAADPCRIFYPHVAETLERLSHSHRLFIVSNCQVGYIELLLAKGNLGALIQDHECFGRTGLPKGESIRILMARNQIAGAAYIGDTQADLNAARLAGIPFVWASYGFGTPDTWDAKISSFSQLPALFAE